MTKNEFRMMLWSMTSGYLLITLGEMLVVFIVGSFVGTLLSDFGLKHIVGLKTYMFVGLVFCVIYLLKAKDKIAEKYNLIRRLQDFEKGGRND